MVAEGGAKSRSWLIGSLVNKGDLALIEALMEEGYREMAEENLRIACEWEPVASEMIMRIPWDELPS